MGAKNKAYENQSIREKRAPAPNAWETDALTCAAHGEGIGVDITTQEQEGRSQRTWHGKTRAMKRRVGAGVRKGKGVGRS